ncbi:MAG: SagB/ThcOx family dehydrogenase [Gammaproteobacteria bacterium]|nr:SagB/ThcOx family dehydrogenase [Gammaproteobacteria bacterium]
MSLAVSTVTLGKENDQRTSLPPVESKGELSVEEAIQVRRSVREFGRGRLDLADVSQLLWSAQGITGKGGYRAAPSAGALYPLELYLVVGDIEGLSAGVYWYRPETHELIHLASGDLRKRLASAALGQSCVRRAPAVLVIASVYKRTTGKYGQRGRRYAHIEVGHAAQNLFLQSEALELATVVVGAFNDKEVISVLDVSDNLQALLLMPVGRKLKGL